MLFRSMLSAATSLKWIQTFTTGVDAVLKLKALRADMILTSLRGVHGPQMSELTFLHMLALCRNYPRVLDNQRNRIWERNAIPTLAGKTVDPSKPQSLRPKRHFEVRRSNHGYEPQGAGSVRKRPVRN